MNNIKLKKLFLVAIVLILAFVLTLTIVACASKDVVDEEKEEEETKVTALITNGDFSTTTGTTMPYTPGTWSGSGDSDFSTNGKAGTIDVGDAYATSSSNWGSLANPGKAKDADEDTKILMVYSPEASASTDATYYAYSNSFSAAIGAYYKVSVDVYTANIQGSDKAGAYIRFSDSAYAKFGPIDTAKTWQTYYFYVQGSLISNTSIGISVSLGMSNALSTGYAFFDNVVAEKINERTYNEAKETYLDNEKYAFYSIRTPDSEFVNTTATIDTSSESVESWTLTMTPADWSGAKGTGTGGTATSSSSNFYSGLISTDTATWTDSIVKYGTNPGTREGATDKNILYMYSFKPASSTTYKPTSYVYTAKRDVQFSLGHVYELSMWVYTDLKAVEGDIDHYDAAVVDEATIGVYYTLSVSYKAVELTSSSFVAGTTYYKPTYTEANVTDSTSGTYYVDVEGTMTKVTLPADYDASETYYVINGYEEDASVTSETTGTYYTKTETYSSVTLDGTNYNSEKDYYTAVRKVASKDQGAWITISGTDDYKFESIVTNKTWQKVTFIVFANDYRNRNFTIKLALGNGGPDDIDTLTSGMVCFDGISLTDKGLIQDRVADVAQYTSEFANSQYVIASNVDETTVGAYYIKNGENYERVNLDGTNYTANTYYTKNYNMVVNLYTDENAELSSTIKYANFSVLNQQGETIADGEKVGLPKGWQFDTIDDVVAKDGEVKVSVVNQDVIDRNILPEDDTSEDDSIKYAWNNVDMIYEVSTASDAKTYSEIKEEYTKFWKDNYGISGNPLLPYDSLAPLCVVSNVAASAYKLTLTQKIVIVPNHSYRIACWVKTMDIASGSGIKVALTDDEGTELTSLSSINTSSYTNELTNDYVELIFYIQGNALVTDNGATPNNEYTFSISLGSGTSYTPSTFLKGAFVVANVNMEEITATEYSDASSGTYATKKAIYSNSSTITNGNFNTIDLEKTKIDADGKYIGAAVIGSSTWTTYDVTDVTTGIINVNNLDDNSDTDEDAHNFYEDLSSRSINNINDIYNIGDSNPWMFDPIDAFRTPQMISAPNIGIVSTNGVATVKYTEVLKSSSFSLTSNTFNAIKLYVKTVNNSQTSKEMKAELRLTTSSANTEPLIETIKTNGKWQEVIFYVRSGMITSPSFYLEVYIGAENEDETYAGTLLIDSLTTYTIDEKEFEQVVIDGAKALNFVTETFAATADSATPTKPNTWTGTGASTSSGYVKSDSQVAGIFDRDNGNIENLGIRNQIVADADKGIEADNTVKEGSRLSIDQLFDATLADGVTCEELDGGFETGNGILLINNLDPTYYTYKSSSFTIASGKYYKITFYARTYMLEKDTYARASILYSDDTYSFAKINTSSYDYVVATEGKYVKTAENEYVEYDASNTTHAALTRYDLKETYGGWQKYTFYIKGFESSSMSTIYLTLALGTSDDKVLGYALFDNVTISTLDADVFNAEFEKVYQVGVDGEPVLVDETALNKEYIAYTDLLKAEELNATSTGTYVVVVDNVYQLVTLAGNNYDSNKVYYSLKNVEAQDYQDIVDKLNASNEYQKYSKIVRYDDKVTCTHDWNTETGKCTICGETCSHSFSNGYCETCGMADPDYEPETNKNTSEYLWAYISSIAIAVILIIVIVVLLVRWFAPKRRAKREQVAYDKNNVKGKAKKSNDDNQYND